MKTILILLICPLFAFAQIGAIREETKTTNPDGSVTFTRKFDPPAQAPPVQGPEIRYYTVPRAAPPAYYVEAPPVGYVAPRVSYYTVPVQAPPTYYMAPAYGRVPVAEDRYGLFGLRKKVYYSDGSSARYGPMGGRR